MLATVLLAVGGLAVLAAVLVLLLRRAAVARAGALVSVAYVLGLALLAGAAGWFLRAATAPRRAREPAVTTRLEPPEGGKTAVADPPAATGAVVYRQNFARTGSDRGPAALDLRLVWAFDTASGRHHLSSPAVRGRRIFGATCLRDVGGNYGSVYCLDADGNAVWEVQEVEGRDLKAFFSSPAVTEDGRFVLIGQGLHFDAGCDLLCLEAATGRLHWRRSAPLNHFEGSPAVRGDLVVAGAGAVETDDGSPPEGPGLVIAVRISDGRLLWEAPIVDPESSPAIGEDGTVYIGSGVGGEAVYALRGQADQDLKAKGLARILWRTPVGHPAIGAVTLAAGKVLIGIGQGDYVRPSSEPQGGVVCLDAATGRRLWFADLGDVVLGAVAVEGEEAVAAIRGGSVARLHLSDGRTVWRERVFPEAVILASPTWAGESVYVVSSDGWLAVLDAACGRVLEKHAVNPPGQPARDGLSLSSPLVSGGRVYVGSETGGLRCYRGTAAR